MKSMQAALALAHKEKADLTRRLAQVEHVITAITAFQNLRAVTKKPKRRADKRRVVKPKPVVKKRGRPSNAELAARKHELKGTGDGPVCKNCDHAFNAHDPDNGRCWSKKNGHDCVCTEYRS